MKSAVFLFSFGFVFSMGFFSVQFQPVEADTLDLPQSCPNDYYSFLLTVRSEHTRQQGIRDVFTLGYCQLYDITELNEALDSLNEAFRAAAFNCEDTSTYKEDYEAILMEQYFVRNVQKTKADVINTEDAEQYEALKTSLLENLRREMVEVFVTQEKRLSEEDLNDYFEDWSSKYDDRIGDYNQCEEGPWAELEDTWSDFIETIQSLDIEVDQPESQSFEDLNNVNSNLSEETNAIGRAFLGTWEYFKNLKNQHEADVEDAVTVKDLGDSGEVYTFDEVLEVLTESDEVFETSIAAQERLSRYELLYGLGSARASTDMQIILVQLNSVLQESNSKDFPNITALSSKVYDKQCN